MGDDRLPPSFKLMKTNIELATLLLKVHTYTHNGEERKVAYINVADIPKSHQEAFSVWMRGQTTIQIDTEPEGAFCVFPEDYLRWLDGRPVID